MVRIAPVKKEDANRSLLFTWKEVAKCSGANRTCWTKLEFVFSKGLSANRTYGANRMDDTNRICGANGSSKEKFLKPKYFSATAALVRIALMR